jgi:hypothetical protein
MRIFVSYTTRDSYINKQRLSYVFSLVSQYGETYVDALHNDSDDKQVRVKSELAIADIVLFLKTSAFYESPWARMEYNQAIKNKKKIVNISIDTFSDWSDTLKNIEVILKTELSANKRFKMDWQIRYASLPAT